MLILKPPLKAHAEAWIPSCDVRDSRQSKAKVEKNLAICCLLQVEIDQSTPEQTLTCFLSIFKLSQQKSPLCPFSIDTQDHSPYTSAQKKGGYRQLPNDQDKSTFSSTHWMEGKGMKAKWKGCMIALLTVPLVLLPLTGAWAKSALSPVPTPAGSPGKTPTMAPYLTAASTPSPAPSSPSPSTKPSPSGDAAEYYKNNVVTIVVGFKAGGGTDTAARLLTPFWPDFMGGTVRIKNEPGGEGVLGANMVYNAKPDGLTLGVYTIGSMASAALFKDPGVKYDISKFTYIGMFGQEPELFGANAKLPAKTMEELTKVKGLKFGATGRKPEMGCSLIVHLFGLPNGAVIPGFPSTPEVGLACARGELDGTVASTSSVKAEIDKGFLKPMLILDRKRSGWYPDAPALMELVNPSPEDQKLLDIYLPLAGGRLLFGPPGMPEDKVKFLREALVQMIGSNNFKKLAEPYWKVIEAAVPGSDVEKTMMKMKAIPEAEIIKFNEVVDKYIRR